MQATSGERLQGYQSPPRTFGTSSPPFDSSPDRSQHTEIQAFLYESGSNEETVNAMEAGRRNELVSVGSVDALTADLNADD